MLRKIPIFMGTPQLTPPLGSSTGLIGLKTINIVTTEKSISSNSDDIVGVDFVLLGIREYSWKNIDRTDFYTTTISDATDTTDTTTTDSTTSETSSISVTSSEEPINTPAIDLPFNINALIVAMFSMIVMLRIPTIRSKK